MWSFKSVTIDNIPGRIVEAAVRKFATKRHTLLDFQSSATYVGTEKYFLGLEKEKSIELTRIRSPFERLLPKLVINFDKNDGFRRYKIRYSLLSFIVLIILSLAIFSNVIYSVSNTKMASDLPTVIIFLLLFILLSLLEIFLTKSILKRAIENTQQSEIIIL